MRADRQGYRLPVGYRLLGVIALRARTRWRLYGKRGNEVVTGDRMGPSGGSKTEYRGGNGSAAGFFRSTARTQGRRPRLMPAFLPMGGAGLAPAPMGRAAPTGGLPTPYNTLSKGVGVSYRPSHPRLSAENSGAQGESQRVADAQVDRTVQKAWNE